MTFSIVARDPETGALGVATATGGPVVGSLVPHGRAGVGAVATQGYTTNPLYGFDGLDLMAGGIAASDVLGRLTAADPGKARRQCVMIDAEGRTAAWTGEEVSRASGSRLERDVAVAGNLLAGDDVLDAMLAAYRGRGDAPLADRLLAALAAGDAAGGDRRGARSAALRTYTSEPYPAIDLRIDWSVTPIADLAPLLSRVRDDDYGLFFQRLPTRAEPGRG